MPQFVMAVQHLPLPVLETILLLLTLFCSVIHISVGHSLNPPYKIHPNNQGASNSVDPNLNMHDIDFRSVGTALSVENLEIYWVNSTVNEISIGWNLPNATGFIKHSIVEYFPTGGRFTSHPMMGEVRNYTFVNLDPGTLYTICVYMAEVYGTNNSTEVLHSKCVKINTIEYIRRDSVIILLITLGYYSFMGLLGYTQWKRKMCSVKNRAKFRSRTSDVDEGGQNRNTTMRYKELEEREHLMMTKPGCSIECNDT